MGAKYAQHFLINQHAIQRIVDSLALSPTDHVLEIGPGKGALTVHLAKAASVSVIEIDAGMVELLGKKFSRLHNLTIFHSDVLKFDFTKLTTMVKVVGNLPYNLTSPILRRLSDWNGWREAWVMVQREVGDRLCAKHGTSEYGALSVGMSLTCEAEFVFELSEKSFDPPPHVKSAVIKLTRRETPLTKDIEGTQRVIQAAFQQRRKTILNSLSHGLGLTKDEVEPVLKRLNVDPGVRPERLPVETFVRLSEALIRNEPPARQRPA